MKLAFLTLIGYVSVASAQLPYHAAPEVSPNGADGWNLDWDGQSGITYFIQYSSDLQNWGYMPIIESGLNAPLGYGFDADGEKMFMRLHYTNIPTSSPNSDDFDGDGIANWDEVRDGGTGTNPLKADTNNDGIRDDGLVYAAHNDPDGAGLSAALQTDLIGRWDFEQLNFATTPPFIYFSDKTGNSNHASMLGGSQDNIEAIVSKSYSTPNTGYLSIPATVMDGVDTFNLSIWVKPTEGSLTGVNANKSRVIWSYGDNTSSLPLLFLVLRDGNKVLLQRYTNGTVENVAIWTTPEDLDDGQWRHFSLARENGGSTGIQYRLHINGEQVGSVWGGPNFTFGNNPNGYFLIGRLAAGNTITQFDGNIDRVLLHSRGLTQPESIELYRNDMDGDGLWDITEHRSHLWRDLNSNGQREANEFGYTINPYYFDDASSDHDGDGRSSLEEQNDALNPTDVANPDSDGDLLPDGWELENNLDPNNPNDATIDSDNDGATNLEEYSHNSDPHDPDTDDDGVDDGIEIGGPDGDPDTPGGSNPNDGSDNGQPLPSDEKLAILIGVGDESGSHSEDYVMHIYRINDEIGGEERFYTLRSGGHGQYKEITLDTFRKTDTYTFQIDWQSSSLETSGSSSNPEGPDFDYTFKVEPQNDDWGRTVDSYDPETNSVDTNFPILGQQNDIQDFQLVVEPKRVLRMPVILRVTDNNTVDDALPYAAHALATEEQNGILTLRANPITEASQILIEIPTVKSEEIRNEYSWRVFSVTLNAEVGSGDFTQPNTTFDIDLGGLSGEILDEHLYEIRLGTMDNGVFVPTRVMEVYLVRDRLNWWFEPFAADFGWKTSQPEKRLDIDGLLPPQLETFQKESLQSVYEYLRSNQAIGQVNKASWIKPEITCYGEFHKAIKDAINQDVFDLNSITRLNLTAGIELDTFDKKTQSLRYTQVRQTTYGVDPNPLFVTNAHPQRVTWVSNAVAALNNANMTKGILLALWQREGSLSLNSKNDMTTYAAWPFSVAFGALALNEVQPTTTEHAKTIFIYDVAYSSLGADSLLRIVEQAGDNFPNLDDYGLARATFIANANSLLGAGFAEGIYNDLSVVENPVGEFTVTANASFYQKMLQLQGKLYLNGWQAEGPDISYMNYNVGANTFNSIRSAQTHSGHPERLRLGIVDWAIHYEIRLGEWAQPRDHAQKYFYYRKVFESKYP